MCHFQADKNSDLLHKHFASRFAIPPPKKNFISKISISGQKKCVYNTCTIDVRSHISFEKGFTLNVRNIFKKIFPRVRTPFFFQHDILSEILSSQRTLQCFLWSTLLKQNLHFTKLLTINVWYYFILPNIVNIVRMVIQSIYMMNEDNMG